MSDEREQGPPPDPDATADWFRSSEPEIDALVLDRIKRRAIAQASGPPSKDTGPAWHAGLIAPIKGAFMRNRPLTTLFLMLGFLGIVGISTLGVAGQLPGQGPQFDAAQSQYDDDDDGGGNRGGGNGRSGDNDDDGSDDPAPIAPGGATTFRNDCAAFRKQNFNTPGKFAACDTATQQAVGGSVTLAQACAGFSRRRQKGDRRSDYAACILAVNRAQAVLRRQAQP